MNPPSLHSQHVHTLLLNKYIISLFNRAMKQFLIIFVISLTAIIAPINKAYADIPVAERDYLLDLYSKTDGANWTNKTNWLGAAGSECTWFGITCNVAKDRVVAIHLQSNKLVGTLPAGLDAFAMLQSFLLSSNQLTGSIPSLGSLPSLIYLSLNNNQLNGVIPSFDQLPALLEVRMQANQLSGAIPSLANTPKLRILRLHNNLLAGNMPSFEHTPDLVSVLLNNNQLTGNIAPISHLAKLQLFDLKTNLLTGPLPPIAGMPLLSSFNVNGNQLSGGIPPLTQLPKLVEYRAAVNKLTGPIPPLDGVPTLTLVQLAANQLTGSLPALALNPGLINFYVDTNQLTGAVPTAPPALGASGSSLCPNNQFTVSVSAAWDAATGTTPWSDGCVAPKLAQSLAFVQPPPVLAVGDSVKVLAVAAPAMGLATTIVYSSATPTVCLVDSTTGGVTTAPGARLGSRCTIAADRGFDALYNTAGQATQSMIVTRNVDKETCRLDVDGDALLYAHTDGVLLLRYLLGFRGSALTSGLTLTGIRNKATDIVPFLEQWVFDVLDNTPPAVAMATRDGRVVYEFLRGAQGAKLVAGSGISAPLAAAVEGFVAGWCGL